MENMKRKMNVMDEKEENRQVCGLLAILGGQVGRSSMAAPKVL